MRLLLNLIWFVLAGVWLFISYAIAGVICFIFIVTIPFGVASFRIAFYGVWPFGRTVIPQADKGVASSLGNILWFVLCGWWLALVHIITGALLCLTIIGIPLGIANFKLLTVSIRPFGRRIVSIEEAQAMGIRGAEFMR
ncbi:MAG: YccF protein [Frankiales bacterium]|nr:YccF protein [Frankiales bacterium]